MIKPGIDVFMNSTSTGKDKRNSILNILSNRLIESVVFDGLYFDYHDKPGSNSEESIGETTKLIRGRFDEIKKK